MNNRHILLISISQVLMTLVLFFIAIHFYGNYKEYHELTKQADSLDIAYSDAGFIVKDTTITDMQKQISDKKVAIEQEKYETIKLKAVGDILVHSNIYHEAQLDDGSYDFTDMFSEVKNIVSDSDIAFANMETMPIGNVFPPSNYPLFSSPVEILDALFDTGFNMLNSASNHSYDYGYDGVKVAIDNYTQKVKSNKFIFSGIATSSEMQNNIQIIEVKGTKIAFISFAQDSNGIPIPNDKQYSFNLYSRELASALITNAKEVSDVQIISMHWGSENSTDVNDMQQSEAEYLSSIGADIILGTHPHVVEKSAMVNNTLVVYSMGNFISGQQEALNQTSGIYEINFTYNKENDVVEFGEYSVTPSFSYNDCWSDGVYTDIMTGCGYNNKVIVKDIEKYDPAISEVISVMKQDPNIKINY